MSIDECLYCPLGYGTATGQINYSSCFHSILPSTFAPYNAVSTNYGQQNTVDEFITVCPGVTLSFTQCSNQGSYDRTTSSRLRLYDQSGSQVANAEYSCDNGAEITYSFTAPCQIYTLSQGCEGSNECNGTTAIVVQG